LNFAELKEKVKKVLKEDETDPKTEPVKYSFRDSFQGKMMEIVIGYALTLALMTAIVPSMLTQSFKIINNELTFPFMFLLSLIGYVSVMCFQIMGSFILDHAFLVWDDIKDHVKPPQIIMDSLVVIVVVGYITFKLIYPYIFGGIR
jgi:hypothetical protein